MEKPAFPPGRIIREGSTKSRPYQKAKPSTSAGGPSLSVERKIVFSWAAFQIGMVIGGMLIFIAVLLGTALKKDQENANTAMCYQEDEAPSVKEITMADQFRFEREMIREECLSKVYLDLIEKLKIANRSGYSNFWFSYNNFAQPSLPNSCRLLASDNMTKDLIRLLSKEGFKVSLVEQNNSISGIVHLY